MVILSGTCFNPLPPSRTGETVPRSSRRGRGSVSIHSRRLGREKRRMGQPLDQLLTVSIHSRRLGREKLTSDLVLNSVMCFNPLPPSRTGETRYRPKRVGAKPCFNPLPPSRTGETLSLRPRAAAAVSIHSRRLGREKLFIQPSSPKCSSFNPLPPSRTGET